MQPNTLYKTTWILWALFFCLALVIITKKHFIYASVTGIYRNSSFQWFTGGELYNGTGRGFIYFPQSAILFAPIAYLPLTLGEILWRILSIGIFSASLYRFANFFDKDYAAKLFAIMTIVTLPLTTTNATNGQMQLLMSGLLLSALADIHDKQWWRATCFLTLALAFKPTAIVIFLLVMGLYPQLRYKLVLSSIIMILFPFLTQNPHYVLSQYAATVDMLHATVNVGISDPDLEWAQLFRLLKLITGYLLPTDWQFILRTLAAFATLGLCFYAKLRFNSKVTLYFIYSLGMIYLLLFNPRTENNDYMMLIPMFGFFITAGAFVTKRYIEVLILAVLLIFMYANYSLSSLLTPSNNIWLKPLMTIFFSWILLTHLLKKTNTLGWLAMTTQKCVEIHQP